MDSVKGIGAGGAQPVQAAQAPKAPGVEKDVGQAQQGGATAAPVDGFQATADLEDEQEAEEKKKAEEAAKAQQEQQELEEKKKELQRQIEAKMAELEEAKKAGDAKKVESLGKEIEGLQNQLAALENQQVGAGPQPVEGAGAGNQQVGGAGAPAPVGGGGAPAAGGNQMAGAPQGAYPATPPELGGYHPQTQAPTGPAPRGQITPNGTGQDAVNLARQYLGRNSADIKGALPNFTAAGGQTNNCADFVSSCLESTGRVQGHHINVREFEQSLQQQGYVQVPRDQAQPGDVWISGSRGHTELVAERGGNVLIGSNNDRPGHQVISEHHNPSGGYYYHLPDQQR